MNDKNEQKLNSEKTRLVFIEIPKGTVNNKFERKVRTNEVFLDFVFENLVWPFNYGEIEGTLGGDGDALDAIVFSTEPLRQTAVVPCVPFGVVLMLDRGEVDDKVMLVPAADPLASQYRDISDFDEAMKQSLIDLYMEIAKQKKKVIEIKGFEGKQFASNLIEKSKI